MKKIMFNDRYGLTKAVIEGRKTVTRRLVSEKLLDRWTDYDDFCNSVGFDGPRVRQYYNETEFFVDNSKYKVGEVVAVAQSYESIHDEMMSGDNYADARFDGLRSSQVYDKPGWLNKMFARADLMPHRIRITDISCERLQDITDGDCMREGISFIPNIGKHYFERTDRDEGFYFDTPREAFASLIDKVSGRGTWNRNPWVIVYEFELVR